MGALYNDRNPERRALVGGLICCGGCDDPLEHKDVLVGHGSGRLNKNLH